MPITKPHSPSYRPDIDGLRAVAVIGVVLFHAGLGMPGGFAGVDVFFVISGYLITLITLRDLQNGEFSILSFWERRIRRILPALTAVVIAVLVFGWFFSLPFHYVIIGQSTIALAALSSNIQFWRTTDYFAPAAEENPLLHTWSLSVEEQFYLIVPFLLLFVFRLRRSHFIPVLFILGCLISFIFAVVHLRQDPSGAFYLLPSRAWELGIGCFLATLSPLKSQITKSAFSCIGLALIVGTFIWYSAEIPFPGIAAIPPVLGAALIIYAGHKNSEEERQPIVNRLLGSKSIVFVGLSSYSFYLWHWPFFAYHRYLTSNPPPVSIAIGYIIASFLIANASLYFIERPFRRRNSTSNRSKVFALGGLTVLLLFTPAIFLWKSGGVRFRVPPEVVELDSANGDTHMMKKSVLTLPHGGELQLLGNEDLKPSLLVWGDSHALALLPAVEEAMSALGRSSVAAWKGGTAPVIEWEKAAKQDYNQSILDFAKTAKNDGLSDVLLVFYWSAYVYEQETPFGFNEPPEGFANALVKTILELQNAGLKVTLFLETPVFPTHVAKASALHMWRDMPPPKLSYSESQDYKEVYEPLIERIRSSAPDTTIFDPQLLYVGEENNIEFIDIDGHLLFKDQSHLTRRGSMRLAPTLIEIYGNSDSSREGNKKSAELGGTRSHTL